MTQVMSMSSGAIDPIAVAKRVFWRPVTASTVLKVGQPVCYSSDSVLDYQERAADPTHFGLTADTYAEGEQEFTGRLLVVEEPLTANLMSFAGIVKCLGPKAGADGDMIEIWIPNGAVVPAYIDASVTLDSSILGIANANVNLFSGGRPVGIAKETIDRETVNGMCWIELNPDKFLYQSGTASTNLTGAVINTLQHTFINTSGSAANLMVHTTASGVMTAGNAWGILNYLAVTAAMTGASYIRGLLSQVMINGVIDGATHISAIHAQLGGTEEVANCESMNALHAEVSASRPTVAGTDLADDYSIVKLSNNAPAECGPNEVFFVYGGSGVEDLFQFHTCLNGGAATDHFIYPHGTGADAYVKNGTGAILKVKVNVDDADYFLMLYSDPEEAV